MAQTEKLRVQQHEGKGIDFFVHLTRKYSYFNLTLKRTSINCEYFCCLRMNWNQGNEYEGQTE